MVAPTDTPSLLGQSGRSYSGSMGQLLSSRSVLVARPGSPPGGCLTGLSVPRPRLLVRRLGSWLGCTSRKGGRFQLMVSGGRLPLDQCSGAAGSRAQSPALSPSAHRLHSSRLRQQLHSSSLPSQLGGGVGGGGGLILHFSTRLR